MSVAAHFYVRVGRWMTAATIREDGALVGWFSGIELPRISLEDDVFTGRAVMSAAIASGKRTRMDVVNSDGLDLPTEHGKGRNTLRRIIELRDGDNAATVIAAYIAYEEQLFAQVA